MEKKLTKKNKEEIKKFKDFVDELWAKALSGMEKIGLGNIPSGFDAVIHASLMCALGDMMDKKFGREANPYLLKLSLDKLLKQNTKMKKVCGKDELKYKS